MTETKRPAPSLLRSWLDSREVTVASFAQTAGVSSRAVHNWLAGDSRPRVDVAVKVEAETAGVVRCRDW